MQWKKYIYNNQTFWHHSSMNPAYLFIVQTKLCLKITLGDYTVGGFLIHFLMAKPTIELGKMFKNYYQLDS